MLVFVVLLSGSFRKGNFKLYKENSHKIHDLHLFSYKFCRNSKVAFINIKCFENINVNLMLKIKLHQMPLMTVKQNYVVLRKTVK